MEFKIYRKIPTEVHAAEIEEDIEVKTKEGVMQGIAGNVLIIGVEGEVYPCDKDIFDKTYEPVSDVSRIGPALLSLDRFNDGHDKPVYLMQTDEYVSFEELVRLADAAKTHISPAIAPALVHYIGHGQTEAVEVRREDLPEVMTRPLQPDIRCDDGTMPELTEEPDDVNNRSE